MTAAEQGAASPPVRPASMYAAKFRGGPGPGTYESSATIVTPRGSPRGTFGTGPQRATFGKERAPPPGTGKRKAADDGREKAPSRMAI